MLFLLISLFTVAYACFHFLTKVTGYGHKGRVHPDFNDKIAGRPDPHWVQEYGIALINHEPRLSFRFLLLYGRLCLWYFRAFRAN